MIVSRYIVGGKPLAYIARIESESDHSRNALDAPGKNAEGNGGLIATAPDLFRELYDATTLIGQLLFDNVLTDPESRQLHNRMLATLQKAEL